MACITNYVRFDQYTRSRVALRENHARDRFDGRSHRAERDYARFVSRVRRCDVRAMGVRRTPDARPTHARRTPEACDPGSVIRRCDIRARAFSRAVSLAVSRAASHPRSKSRCDSRSPATARIEFDSLTHSRDCSAIAVRMRRSNRGSFRASPGGKSTRAGCLHPMAKRPPWAKIAFSTGVRVVSPYCILRGSLYLPPSTDPFPHE